MLQKLFIIGHIRLVINVPDVFLQLNSPEDNTTLVNLIYFLQERQRRRQTLTDDLSRKRKLLQCL